MNQRDEYRDNERFERDRESSGGRNWRGFDDSRERGYEAGPQGRERDWDRWRGSGAEGHHGPRDEGRWQAPRRFARGPKGYQRSDERIKEDISERLMESYHIDSSDVTVEVKGGVVTLDGTVPHRHMRHAIENVADNCLGVQDIDNRIRVKSQLEQAQSQTSVIGGTPGGASSATKTRQ